jgi:hypothetical protein
MRGLRAQAMKGILNDAKLRIPDAVGVEEQQI